jgi:hypothetical protein
VPEALQAFLDALGEGALEQRQYGEVVADEFLKVAIDRLALCKIELLGALGEQPVGLRALILIGVVAAAALGGNGAGAEALPSKKFTPTITELNFDCCQ